MDIRNYMYGTPDGQLAKDYHSIYKQLLRDVCSIPLPTPRSLGLDFLPDAGNQEFTYLVGLEVIVQERLREPQGSSAKQRKNTKGATRKETAPPHNDPKTCGQCSTDFTCRWWCVTSTDTGTDQACDQCKTSSDKAMIQAYASKLEETLAQAKQMKLEAKQRLLQGRSLVSQPKANPPAMQLVYHGQRI